MKIAIGAGGMNVRAEDVELEASELEFHEIKRLVSKTHPVIFEFGANEGQSTLGLLQWIPKANIFAFEPDPRANEKFKEKILNDNVVLAEVAIDGQNGTCIFHQSSGEGASWDWNQSGSIRVPAKHLESVPHIKLEKITEVPIVRLDDWAAHLTLDAVDFIWADIQGAEMDLILGGKETLKKTRFFYTEYRNQACYNGQSSLDEICEALSNLGLVLYRRWFSKALFVNKHLNDLNDFDFKIPSKKNCPCGSLLSYKTCHMKNTHDLSIIVLTNRPLNKVAVTIANIAKISDSSDARLIISDNSGEPLKAVVLEKEYGDSYHISPEPEAVGNVRFATSKCSTRFLWNLHDDDWVFELDGAMPKHIPPEYVGMCPIILLSSAAQGVYGFRNFDLCQGDPVARIDAYVSQSESAANSLEFAIWETGLLRNITRIMELHPCPAGYQDWSIRKAMLAEGKVLSIDRFGYKYNNNNWFGPGPAILNEIESLMRRSQLPIILAKHMNELTFIDLVCLFGRNQGYRLSLGDRRVVLDTLLSRIVSDYKPQVLGDYLNHLLEFIRRIDYQTGERYQAYVEKAINPPPMESQS